MTKKTKALLMNLLVLTSLAFFYFKGTQPLVVLISGIICLVILNVVLAVSKAKN